MIDVHAPHGGLHTWRDFWIHLGTIALGLLIAISLEQTVEWMHHLHQRHQLEADLSAELEVNHDVVLGDLRRGALLRVRMVALRDGADRMHDSGGKLKFAYIPNPKVDPKTKLRLPSAIVPSDAAWATAKESELVGLLPRWEAEVYARLDLQHEFLVDSVKGFLQAESAVKAFEVRFEQNGDASVGPDMARITISQLDDYSVLLSREMQTSDELSNRLNLYDAEAQAILHGARSEQEMLRHMQETGRN